MILPVSISILTYNRRESLEDLISSLIRLSYRPLEIIVVDNCSQDDTEQMISAKYPGVLYIRTLRNMGADARNFGLRQAKGEIVITLDDDIKGISDNDILNIAQIFSKHPLLGALNFKVLDTESGMICNWVHHCKQEDYSDQEFLTYEITEGAVAFRKAAVESVGFYPEGFFLSHEGPDLALRLLDKGYKVIYSPSITVRHAHSQLGRKNWLNYYYDTRNLIWVAARHFPLVYATRYLLKGLCSMMVYSIRDGYLRHWLKAIYDGLKELPAVFKKRKALEGKTMRVINEIDRMRPSIFYQLNRRLFRKSARL